MYRDFNRLSLARAIIQKLTGLLSVLAMPGNLFQVLARIIKKKLFTSKSIAFVQQEILLCMIEQFLKIRVPFPFFFSWTFHVCRLWDFYLYPSSASRHHWRLSAQSGRVKLTSCSKQRTKYSSFADAWILSWKKLDKIISGFPLWSGYISLFIPPLAIIQIQSPVQCCVEVNEWIVCII